MLHNGNKFVSVPIGHSVIVKEHYLNVNMVLQKLRYSEHNCAICVDFNKVDFLLGQQGEYTLTSLLIVLIISPKPILISAWKNLKQIFLMNPKFAN